MKGRRFGYLLREIEDKSFQGNSLGTLLVSKPEQAGLLVWGKIKKNVGFGIQLFVAPRHFLTHRRESLTRKRYMTGCTGVDTQQEIDRGAQILSR